LRLNLILNNISAPMRLISLIPALFLVAGPAIAQESPQELSRRIDQLARQVEDLRIGEVDAAGHGYGASKIYQASQGVSVGGYGEMLFTGKSGDDDRIDFYRAATHIGYRFDENWAFNSEIEIEHSNEVTLEFAYLDWLNSDSLNFRVGHLLVPSGWINEMHEPTTFWSSDRPELERELLPSTWHGNGFGAWGNLGEDFSYRVYLMEGFNASSDGTDYDAVGEGLRDWRQKGSYALANNSALAARLDWEGVDGLVLGASLFSGDSGQDTSVVNYEDLPTTLTDVHFQYDQGAFRVRGLWADGDIGRDSGIDEELGGWYVEAGYDLLAGSDSSLIPFLRTSTYDLDAESSSLSEVESLTLGVAWQPIVEIIFKADHTTNSSADGSEEKIFGVAVGYVF
jgi:hypothetical protein